MNILIQGLNKDHTEEQLLWVNKEIYKFLQNDEPKRDIFHTDFGFGLQLKELSSNSVKVNVVYNPNVQNKRLQK